MLLARRRMSSHPMPFGRSTSVVESRPANTQVELFRVNSGWRVGRDATAPGVFDTRWQTGKPSRPPSHELRPYADCVRRFRRRSPCWRLSSVERVATQSRYPRCLPSIRLLEGVGLTFATLWFACPPWLGRILLDLRKRRSIWSCQIGAVKLELLKFEYDAQTD
jgi:hypothetical protein